ncbi:uncharacterized protein EI90DRAFT_1904952 [Cantharellus anzutake]|uniref:uncharacterized protein n=1 Tax=Cantharellus anzutake TaxID=1750568 RepID=UPI0019053BB0|nr:uncharacterized protein EI90DRAFT_1904952 [Cantharellus anzutake]KAF8326560.1 hypothetical protein EI90DRAFT_1904952 [Cantharellus anzutake]
MHISVFSLTRLFTLCFSILIFVPAAYAAPHLVSISELIPRQDGPTTFQTTVTSTNSLNIRSAGNTFVQRCTITLTPVTAVGQEMVLVEQSCDAGTMTTTTATMSDTQPSSTSPTQFDYTSSRPIFNLNTITTSSSSSVPTSTEAPQSLSQSRTITSARTTNPTTTFSTRTSTSTSIGTATAGQLSVPGRTVSVLPIGLGVFASVSVIGIIVVGVVTWERTKYRKAFRARRLAEAGGTMAYTDTAPSA